MTIQFKTVDNSKWEKLTPVTPQKPPDKYTPILDTLESGEIVAIETVDAKESKGLRISIARKASTRGFKVEYRAEGSTLYVKKSQGAIVPKAKGKVAQNV